jgi:predicted ATPase
MDRGAAMTFDEILEQVIVLLQRQKRVAYGALKRRFDLTYRPTFQPPWTGRAHVTPLTLTRLPAAQVEAMVARLTGGKPLPAEVLRHVVTKTDGVPLFAEELTKMLLESGLRTEAEDRYALAGSLPALAAWRTTGAEMARPYFPGLLAEAYGKGGQTEEGLTEKSKN